MYILRLIRFRASILGPSGIMSAWAHVLKDVPEAHQGLPSSGGSENPKKGFRGMAS